MLDHTKHSFNTLLAPAFSIICVLIYSSVLVHETARVASYLHALWLFLSFARRCLRLKFVTSMYFVAFLATDGSAT